MDNFADRVKETATTTGTGDFTLAGAATNFRTFSSVFAVNDRVWYCIEDSTNNAWEVGLGTLTASTTLNRTIVTASSNAGALVNFAAGTKNVFVTIPGIHMNRVDTRGRMLAHKNGQDLR